MEIPNYGEGESNVFRVPNMKCTSPEDHEHYEYSHSIAGTDRCTDPYIWGHRMCPVHCDDLNADPWIAWARARELYATTENEEARPFFLEAMLNRVSEDNPPNKPWEPWMKTEPANTKTKTWHDIDGRPHHYEIEVKRLNKVNIMLAIALTVWIVLAVFGVMTIV